MKTSTLFPTVLLALAVSGSMALAQDTSAPAPAAMTIAQPTSPAPAVINGYVYVAKLPTPTQLLKDAEAEGLTIARMEQSADRMIVVYQYPNGSTRTFAYTPAAAQGSTSTVQAPPLATAMPPTRWLPRRLRRWSIRTRRRSITRAAITGAMTRRGISGPR